MERIAMDPANRAVLREAPLDALRSFLTPTSQHFVLAALGIPRPRPGEWSVRVGGAVVRRQVLSLEVLRALPAPSVTFSVWPRCSCRAPVFSSMRMLGLLGCPCF